MLDFAQANHNAKAVRRVVRYLVRQSHAVDFPIVIERGVAFAEQQAGDGIEVPFFSARAGCVGLQHEGFALSQFFFPSQSQPGIQFSEIELAVKIRLVSKFYRGRRTKLYVTLKRVLQPGTHAVEGLLNGAEAIYVDYQSRLVGGLLINLRRAGESHGLQLNGSARNA